jgi:tetratricopeptide (TPR) repeat protein
MDGRRLRRWCLCGGLVLGPLGCKSDYYSKSNLPQPGDTVGTVPPGQFTKKSFWGGNQLAAQPAAVPDALPKRKPGQQLLPGTDVALADVQASSAFDERNPPANREQLLDSARQGYHKALQKDPKHKGAMLGLAGLYARMGDQDRASDLYRKYLGLYPNDHEVMHEVALAHARWKDFAGAEAWCEAALKLDPENRNYRKTLGFLQARGGKWDQGFATLCRIMPEAKARMNMAGLLDQLGHPDASRQQLQLAIAADPNYAPAREFLAELDQPAQPPVPATAGQADPVMQAGYQPR